MMHSSLKKWPLIVYLSITYGVLWGIGLLYILLGPVVTPILGELDANHPLVWVALYSPSFAGLLVYLLSQGPRGVAALFRKLVPTRQGWSWLGIAALVVIVYQIYMRLGALALGVRLPAKLVEPGLIGPALLGVLLREVIGVQFGWIGFLLPWLQQRLKNPILASLLTGFLFAFWLLPGFAMSQTNGNGASYLVYIFQLMAFMGFLSLLFNQSGGNLLLPIVTFWLVASGSALGLYEYNTTTEVMECIFFAIIAPLGWLMARRSRNGMTLQRFPGFLHENDPASNSSLQDTDSTILKNSEA